MSNELIINATLPETRIALLENDEIQELLIERESQRGIVGNIYKGKVIRVLPGMQAAFVDIGLEKAAFLYVDDVFFPDMIEPLAIREMRPEPEPVIEVESTDVTPSEGVAERAPQMSGEAGEASPQPQGASAPAPQQGQQPRRHERGDRNRGGRDRNRGGRNQHHGRGGQQGQRDARSGQPNPNRNPNPNRTPGVTPPGSPEDHAELQRLYGRQMLDIDESDLEPKESKKTGDDDSGNDPIRAGSDPGDGDFPGQPPARSPKDGDGKDEESTKEDEGVAEHIYRPAPEIDPNAWEEDLEEFVEAVEEGSVAVEAEGSEEQALQDGAAPSDGRRGARESRGSRGRKSRSKNNEDRDDDEEAPRRKRRRDAVSIADLVREGQDILVQVAKEPIGTKGARLTCHISLPGRYLVFMPTVDHIGVSRRIESDSERRRMKDTMSQIRPAKTGVIVRTASGKQTDQKLRLDLEYLVETWNDIQKKYQKQRTPTPVYTDLTFVLRAIRDMFTDEVDRVIVDSKREHKAIMKFVTRFMPNVKDKVQLYSGDVPLFDAYGIEAEIERSLERKVWLKSGGYLVVDQAEALVAIDVNTGRYVGKKNLEETILKTNLEAVEEIAYQLRIRNFGGIIILDLIDMEKESNRDRVFKALEEALKKDRARPTIMKISQLGLIEMTRKRTRDSLVRSICESCSYCKGRGYVKNKDTIAYDIMRDIEREGVEKETVGISIQCHPTVADVLLEDKRDVLEDLEHQFGKKISVRSNGAYHMEQYELQAQKEDGKSITWQSEERKKHNRQKLAERHQQASAERKKQALADREAARAAAREAGLPEPTERGARGQDQQQSAGGPERGDRGDRGAEGDGRRRRRRGRRGRGGRNREFTPGGPNQNQQNPSQNQLQQQSPHPRPQQPRAEGEISASDAQSSEGPDGVGTGLGVIAADGTPGNPGERPRGKRRRGRRGGRRHRGRFRQPGAPGAGASDGGSGGSAPDGGGPGGGEGGGGDAS